MYVIGLLPPSSLSLSSLSLALLLPSQSRESFFCPDTLFFTFDINANLSTSSQAAKVVKHIPVRNNGELPKTRQMREFISHY